MCSICGIIGEDREHIAEALKNMSAQMSSRGPDQNGIYLNESIAFAHNRLAIIDKENGKQPMTRIWQGQEYTIVYNGELYNTPELRTMLEKVGFCDIKSFVDAKKHWLCIVAKK